MLMSTVGRRSGAGGIIGKELRGGIERVKRGENEQEQNKRIEREIRSKYRVCQRKRDIKQKA